MSGLVCPRADKGGTGKSEVVTRVEADVAAVCVVGDQTACDINTASICTQCEIYRSNLFGRGNLKIAGRDRKVSRLSKSA